MVGSIRDLHHLQSKGFDVRAECPRCGYARSIQVGELRVLFGRLKRREDWYDAPRRWLCSGCGRRVARIKLTAHPAPEPEAVMVIRSSVNDAYLGEVDERAVRAAIGKLQRFVEVKILDAYLESLSAPDQFRTERGIDLKAKATAVEAALYPDAAPATARIVRQFGPRYAALLAPV